MLIQRCDLLFQVDDGEYFQTLPENSIFMFLRTGESWHPTGSDSIKAGEFTKILNKAKYDFT